MTAKTDKEIARGLAADATAAEGRARSLLKKASAARAAAAVLDGRRKPTGRRAKP